VKEGRAGVQKCNTAVKQLTASPCHRSWPMRETAGKPRRVVFLHDPQVPSFPCSGRKWLQQQDPSLLRLLGQGGHFRAIRAGNAAQPTFPELRGTSAHNFWETGEKKEVFPQK